MIYFKIMTNAEAKQQAIKKAYGELWPTVEEFTYVDSGKCHTSFYKPNQNIFDFRTLPDPTREKFFFYGQNGHVLPKSIEGIENNNGWIRIEPDGSNLPDSSEVVKWINIYSGDSKQFCIDDRIEIGDFTHYKPITAELKPIY